MQNDIITNKERQILQSQSEIDWLKRQIQQLNQDLKSPPVPLQDIDQVDQVDENINEYKKRLDALRNQLDVITQFNLSKDCLAQSVDTAHFGLQSLYPPDDQTDKAMSERVEEAIHKKDDLVIAFMKKLEDLQKVKAEIALTQRKIIERHQENRQLMKSIHEIRQTYDDSESDHSLVATQDTNRSERIHETQNRLEIARNVLIGLILESKIDWANSRRWFEVMMRAGDELE